jgi:hypothetical protein
MKKQFPPKPLTLTDINWHGRPGSNIYYQLQFDSWYDENIRSLGEGSVVVTNEQEWHPGLQQASKWYQAQESNLPATHAAILIGVQEIPQKELTADELLQNMVKRLKTSGESGDWVVLQQAELYLAKKGLKND